ncbi:ELMO domain-containing protein [Citrus sinensis]|nr:ELMO domain-containing protein [Citrus sinensis]
MTSKTLRRRLHHEDVGGRGNERLESSGYDGLSEPLLANYQDGDQSRSEGHRAEDLWDDEEKKARLHWMFIFSQLITQWAQWLVASKLGNMKLVSNLIGFVSSCVCAIMRLRANIVFGSGSLIGRILPLTSGTQNGISEKLFLPSLTSLQEERLRYLQQRLEVPFDGSQVEHQDALKQLWRLAYPGRELPPLKSELWKEMGWQGTDPSTDFRGGGFISLENLIFFAKKYPVCPFLEIDMDLFYLKQLRFYYLLLEVVGRDSFQRLLHKQDGTRAEWEYPFAVAGINISFMLIQMLDLQSGKPSSSAGIRFLELLEKDEMAFDNLYCVAFRMMDAQWLAKRATYMEFNDVLKSTRAQLERELKLEDVSCVRDLPAYNLLHR